MNINVTLFAQVIAFALLIWFVNKFLWGPITNMLAERQKRIADGLAAADKGRHELEEAEQKIQAEIEQAKSKAQEILAAAQKRAAAIEDEARQKAQQEGEKIRDAAQADAEQEYVRVREQLRKQLAEISIAGASKILRKEVDSKAHSDMLNELAAQL